MGDLAEDFWEIVGKRADPTELNVGDVFRLDFGGELHLKIVTHKWVDNAGKNQIQITDAPFGTRDSDDLITVVVPRT